MTVCIELLIILIIIDNIIDRDFVDNCVDAGYSRTYCESQK